MALILISALSFSVWSETVLNCTYTFYNTHFADVEVAIENDGKIRDHVWVNMYGREHVESFAPETPAPGEWIHGWISKESPENAIELIIYENPQAGGNSKLVNPRIPIGQDVWGECSP